MHITKCTSNILEKRSWFSSSIRPRMETTLDSSNPRNVILLCTAGLIKSIVKTRFGSLEGKSFVQIYWNGILYQIIIYIWIIIYLMHLVLFHYNNTFRIIYHKCFIIVSYMYGTVYISFVFFIFYNYINYHIWFTTYMNYEISSSHIIYSISKTKYNL